MSKRLFIIGNGFDRFHGIPSSYGHFRGYLEESGAYSFLKGISKFIESDDLWSNFEAALGCLNLLKIEQCHYYNCRYQTTSLGGILLPRILTQNFLGTSGDINQSSRIVGVFDSLNRFPLLQLNLGKILISLFVINGIICIIRRQASIPLCTSLELTYEQYKSFRINKMDIIR